jgi:hypothetical protein
MLRDVYAISDGTVGALRQVREVGPELCHRSEDRGRAMLAALPWCSGYRLYRLTCDASGVWAAEVVADQARPARAA